MIYAGIRERIWSGDLLAWSHRGWGSWYDLQIQAVRIFTRSEYAHVGIAWRAAGRVFVIEAVRPKVRLYPLSLLRPFFHVPTGAQWSPQVEDWALEQVGKDYSRWQAVLAGMGRLAEAADDRWQCAELARAILAAAGVELEGLPTPTDVVAGALKRGVLSFVE